MKAIYIDGLPTIHHPHPMIVEIEPAGTTQMKILKVIGGDKYVPTRAYRGFFIPYSDEVWKTCQDMDKQYDTLWKMQLALKDMAMKEVE